MIVSFGNQKGGVGKTTLTILCANALSSPPFNASVFVVDADPQQSIIKRRLVDAQGLETPTPYPVEYKNLPDFQRDIHKLDKEYDFVFLDVPGKLDINLPPGQQEIVKYLQYVDVVLLPFVPGNFALESTLEYLKVCLKVRSTRQDTPRPLRIFGLINLFEKRTLDDKYLIEEIEELKSIVSIDFIKTKLPRYSIFRATDTLTSLYNTNNKSDKPILNFTTFINDLLKTIGYE